MTAPRATIAIRTEQSIVAAPKRRPATKRRFRGMNPRRLRSSGARTGSAGTSEMRGVSVPDATIGVRLLLSSAEPLPTVNVAIGRDEGERDAVSMLRLAW